MKKPLLPLFALLLASVTVTSAYPLRILPWDEEVAGRKLAISHSKGTEELADLHPSQRSRIFQVTPAEGSPAVIQVLDRTDAEGKPAVSLIKIPEGVKRPLLILLPDEQSDTGLRTLVLEDDISGFNWGSVRLVNATGKKLVFKWEKRLVAIPDNWTPLQVSPGGSNRNMQVELFLHDQPHPPLYAAVWEHRDHYRTLVFIVAGDDARLGPVVFKFINEDKRVVDAEEALRRP